MKRVKCERFVQKGFCIGFENKTTYLIRGAIPEEEVEIRITDKKRKGKIIEGEVFRVLRSSPYRVYPVCKYYGECGGCDFQHIEYNKQLEYKKEILIDALRHNGGIEVNKDLIDVVEHSSGWNYRNKFSMPYDHLSGKLGFYRRNTHDIVVIEKCDIIDKRMNETLQFLNNNLIPSLPLRYVIGRVNYKGDVSVVFISRREIDLSFIDVSLFKNVYLNINNSEGNRIIGDRTITVKGNDYIEDRWNGIEIRYSPTSFLQVNKEIAEEVYREVKDNIKGKRVCDLFSGIGILSIYLSLHGFEVVGVESFDPAVKSANLNNYINGTSVKFICGDANQFEIGEFDTVVIDPPRKGIDKVLAENLSCFEGRIIYMSCYPQTLARDVKEILKRGKKIIETKVFDMFPQTHHFETLITIE